MSKKKYSLKIILILLILLAIAAAFFMRNAKKKEAQVVIVPKIVVIKLKGTLITDEDFEKRFITANPDLGDMDDKYYLNVLKKDYAYKLADEIILKRFAAGSGISVSKEELNAELAGMKEGYTGDSFKEMLASEGLTFAGLKTSIEKRLLMQKVLGEKVFSEITVSDNEIADFYHLFKNNYITPERYKIERITVQDEARASEVYELLKSKKIDFGAARDEYSLSENSEDEVEVDYIPASGLTEEVYNAIVELKSGNMTGIINNSDGFHIIKLLDRKKARQLKLEEVKGNIDRLLRENKEKAIYSTFINDLRKENDIVILDDYFKVPSDED